MKLKDKFNDLVPVEFGGIQEPLLTNCVDVAKDFAIGFGLFLRTKCITTDYLSWFYNGKYHLEKELLEIYIKEK